MNAVDEYGYTAEERAFRARGARWHNGVPGDKNARRGWYLPHDGGGLPLRAEDRERFDQSPFGTFLGADLNRAVARFEEIYDER